MYSLNGTTKTDVLTGSELSIQRNGSAVHIDFPNGDGAYVFRFSKRLSGKQDPVTWVSYAHADWVSRSKIKSDTPTEVS